MPVQIEDDGSVFVRVRSNEYPFTHLRIEEWNGCSAEIVHHVPAGAKPWSLAVSMFPFFERMDAAHLALDEGLLCITKWMQGGSSYREFKLTWASETLRNRCVSQLVGSVASPECLQNLLPQLPDDETRRIAIGFDQWYLANSNFPTTKLDGSQVRLTNGAWPTPNIQAQTALAETFKNGD
jgi:hypothetical protein